MAIIVGIAGAARNAAVALYDGERVVVCEQERVTRTRRAALRPGQLPVEALDTVLRVAGHSRADISAYAVAERAIELPPGLPVERVDHHAAHAATAFYSSSVRDAVVLVCDRSGAPQLTVWRGDGRALTREELPWTGPSFAEVYGRLAEAFGSAPDGDEPRLEALAHAAGPPVPWTLAPIRYCGDHLEVSPALSDSIARVSIAKGSQTDVLHAAAVASGGQRHVGDALVQLVSDVKRQFGGRHLCLGGGLFYNSFFTTLLAESGLYERTFVPVNPGNGGVALGAALHVATRHGASLPCAPLSPFLGPDFDTNEIKTVLDNCKLSYDYADGRQIAERTATALAQGKLVGWFQGRMEWGPRALGNRSILASPVAPFVLENLNGFLKKREPHRSYSVAVCEEDAPRYFQGPTASPFMEFEYSVLQPDILRALLPLGATRLRVQTVPKSAGAFYSLIKAFGAETGVPILVNTSFNGFNEPIVCTPRDAVRVFYGTGLDTVAIGGFILQK
jgi:carbamoyltransferase